MTMVIFENNPHYMLQGLIFITKYLLRNIVGLSFLIAEYLIGCFHCRGSDQMSKINIWFFSFSFIMIKQQTISHIVLRYKNTVLCTKTLSTWQVKTLEFLDSFWQILLTVSLYPWWWAYLFVGQGLCYFPIWFLSSSYF